MPLQRNRSRQKALGQNFLIDTGTARRIVSELNPLASDLVLEIGPGPGILTERIVDRVSQLICLEVDSALARNLQERWGELSSFDVVCADALTVDLESLPWHARSGIRVLSNLPYSVATPIVQKLLRWERVSDMVLMVQKEVADRMEARPRSKDRGYFSLVCQLYCRSMERVLTVGPGVFRPPPKVDSTVLHLRVHETPAGGVEDPEGLLQLVSIGFAHRRKTLYNNLRRAYSIDPHRWAAVCTSSRLQPTVRAEELELADWISLRDALTE